LGRDAYEYLLELMGRFRKGIRWLHPGMRVKRWGLLATASMLLVVFAILSSAGRGWVAELYRLMPKSPQMRISIIVVAFIIGIAGFSYALFRLVRSIARGVAPGRDEKPSQIIYRTRLLQRGPAVVAIGGGTGLSTLLRGLKEETSNITAIVTVMDDGGSSGRLRHELDVLPPGDIRNCILALAEDEQRIARLFQHRFWAGPELAGHSLGNILLVGLEQATGGFDRAIEEMSYILNVIGEVVPATLEKTHLRAQMVDGNWVEGESQITADPRRIKHIELSKSHVQPYHRVLEAIESADLILLGPGSLYTSIIPSLLVEGIADGIAESAAEKILIGNLMTQPGETDGLSLLDHLEALAEYLDVRCFEKVIVNHALPPDELIDRYKAEAAEPVTNDLAEANKYQIEVVTADLIGFAEFSGKQTVKHDPAKLARAIVHASRSFSRHQK
jgi:uncharacterized cofD-like protein